MFSSDIAASNYIKECGGNATELPETFQLTSPSYGAPNYPKWKFDAMYKLDARGLRWVWQIGFDGLATWTLNGPITSTNITTAVVKLASESTLSKQAFITCNSNYLDKYRSGYLFPGDNRERFVKAMKGYEYMGNEDLIFPVVVDAKIDGIRALCSMRDGEVKMMSFGNTSLDYITHIRSQVKDLMAYLPEGTTVDGELYKHGMLLFEIQSIVRSYKNIKDEMSTIDYYVFDISCPDNDVIEVRYPVIVNAFNLYRSNITYKTNLKLVPKNYAYSHEDIEESFRLCVANGFEGIIIRHSSIGRREGTKQWDMSKYSSKKSKAMLKYKQFFADEGIVIGVIRTEGKEKDLCKLLVKLSNDYDLPLRYGSAGEKRKWLANNDLVLGRVLKFEHTGFNPDTGIPQRPRAIGFREVYE